MGQGLGKAGEIRWRAGDLEGEGLNRVASMMHLGKEMVSSTMIPFGFTHFVRLSYPKDADLESKIKRQQTPR